MPNDLCNFFVWNMLATVIEGYNSAMIQVTYLLFSTDDINKLFYQ